MKSVYLFVLGLFATLMVFVASCKDEHENAAPVLTIIEPADGSMVALGNDVHMEASATDDESLHEMSVLILSHMGDTVFANYPTVHGLKTFDFHEHWTTTDTGMYHVHYHVVDHDDASASGERMVHVH